MATQDISSRTESPVDEYKISVFATELLSDFPERSWTIHLVNTQTGQESSQFTLLDPFSQIDYEELRWYIEDFALQDPFASDRAMRIAQSQARYGKHLATSLLPHISEITFLQGGSSSCGLLQLLIFGDGTLNSLHSLRWELIERAECCQPANSIIVSRISKQAVLPLYRMIDIKSTLRILYVSARPALDEDISYRAVSRQILDLAETSNEHFSRVIIEFVRPGTWKNFKKVLKSRGQGYFDIVQFDMHGTIERRAGNDTAYLHFSSQGAASKRSDPKSPRQIARELAASGVRLVVLNACNGATASRSDDSNLAHVIASHGINFVIAMAYGVKTDAATLFMQKLYSKLFTNGGDVPNAVKYARSELRLNRGRTGRYGMTVLCDDECNLVCYVAKQDSNMGRRVDDPVLANTLSQALTSADTPSQLVMNFGKEILGDDPPSITRIQDLDILSAEELFVGNDVVFITGESGTGKSTLARQMQAWWKRTTFARAIEYFESPQDIDNWLESPQRTKSSKSHSAEPVADGTVEPLMEHSFYNYDQILLLDNVESWDTLLDNTVKKEQSRMLNLIKRCQESQESFRILFFTRMTEDILLSRFPGKVVNNISIPTVEEAAALAAYYLSEQTTLSQADAAALEELIKYHRMNLNFLHLFVPRMTQLNIQPKNFIDCLLEDPQVSDFETFHDYIESERSAAPVFKLVHDHVQTWSQEHILSFRMFFTFCMFQHRIPQDVRFWLHKLYEKGVFSGGKPAIEPFSVESGKIHWYELEGWESFPKDWDFESSWLRVENCLKVGGLIREEKMTTGATEQYFRVHPLLPYFLRHEITRLPFRDPQKYWSNLRQAYWEYYEVRANTLTLSFLQSPSSRYSTLQDINNDVINLDQAVKLSTEQLCFPFRTMRVYNLVPYLNFTSMTQVQLRRWAYLLDKVLARFELLHSERQWSEIPSQNIKQSMLLYSMQIADCLGRVFEELGMSKTISENAERALRVKSAFMQDFHISTNNAIDSILYEIQVRRAKAIPIYHWSLTDLELFEELLLTKPPDGLQSNGGRMKAAKAELVNHLAHEKRNIPENHPLHALIEEVFQEGLAFIQSIFLENPALSEQLSLGGRTAVTFPAGEDQAHSSSVLNRFLSGENVVQIYRNIHKDFISSSLHSADARAYTVDPEALLRHDKFPYDRAKLRQMYEISQHQRNIGIQAFCLEQLSIAAVIDGDSGAIHSYLRAWNELDQNLFDAGQLTEAEAASKKERREILLKALDNGAQNPRA